MEDNFCTFCKESVKDKDTMCSQCEQKAIDHKFLVDKDLVFNLKETRRYKNGKPIMENDNWFQVYGPKSKELAQKIADFLNEEK
jgi:hypothetical protein